MNITTVRRFFGWCTVLNGGLLIIFAVLFRFSSDWIFGMHSHWVTLTREQFNLAIYLLLGIFKLLVIVFNVVPYVALVIMSRQQRKSSIP